MTELLELQNTAVAATPAEDADAGKKHEKHENSFSAFAARWRKTAIGMTPGFIVNNSSNVLGFIHLFAEFAMFKSNGTSRLINEENIYKPWRYPIDPIVNIYKSTLSRARFKFNPRALTQWSSYTNAFHNILDVERATKMDSAALLPGEKLVNRFQARSTLFGFTAWTLNMLIPEQKDSPEETERMSDMMVNRPLSYVGLRIKQGLWIPDWWNHKRQMTGLGALVGGVFSTLGGFRGVRQMADGSRVYYRNWVSVTTGLISTASSIPLLFSVDDDAGYSKFGSTIILKLFAMPAAIWAKFANFDVGKWWYTTGTLTFTGANFFAALVGGAEKRPDGTIVDHTAIREQARARAKQHKEAMKHAQKGDDIPHIPAAPAHAEIVLKEFAPQAKETPSKTVAHVASREKALPESAKAAQSTHGAPPA